MNKSKFLSLILRHKPELIDLKLDEYGYANITELVEKINLYGINIDREEVFDIVSSNNKKRFKTKGDMIRASQGHSIEVNLEYSPKEPPVVLYHGTAINNLESILTNGIIKGSRNHVHLSSNIETAISVGKRHGKPIVLEIDSHKMYEDGFEFYLSDNNVWLSEYIPTIYIKENPHQ